MAQLTPLAKGILAVTILSVTGAAAWHLGLKDKLGAGAKGSESGGEAAGAASPELPVKAAAGKADPSAPLGSKSNPLKVSIVSFHGYAPALVANGKSLTTQPGSIFEKNGVHVEFVIQDDIPTLSTIFTSNVAHCAWRTSDFWAQEQPNLRNNGQDARAVVIVDNTQGGDAIIAKDPAIQSVEDLAGRSVAMLQFTPSHGMTTDAVENSALSARKKQSVRYVFINADEGTAGVRAAFASGQVDAAALWDPDLALAIKAVPGAHVIYSTKIATNLIFDVMVCDQKHLGNAANEAVFTGFVKGWLDGVLAARANPDDAVEALVANEELFRMLEKSEGRAFVKSLFDNVVWTSLEDNVRILGLAGGTNHYERVYGRFDQIYRAAGALANPNSPVIPPQDSFDYRFVKKLAEADQTAKAKAAEPQFKFTEAEQKQVVAKEANLTKPVTVSFKSGSVELSKRAQKTVDDEMVPLIENLGSAYFEVSGNTDSTGARATNLRLSQQRAEAVVNYLVEQWEFPRTRFKILGNGPDKPLCDEDNPGAEGLDLEQCREANRSTRLAVYSR
jgi:NitT/TauT family transport system substrate-binding protein